DDLKLNWEGSWADYDNDGDPDVLLVNGATHADNAPGEPLALYRNDLSTSGRFTAVTDTAGITHEQAAWWGASWADYDLDGWLDFVVVPERGRVWLSHNRGDGPFEEFAAAQGIDVNWPYDDGKNPVWFDYDLDGYPDLYLAAMGGHRLYHNDHGQGFTDVTSL